MKKIASKAFSSAAALIMVAASAGYALAKEQVVTIPVDGQSVVGTLETPDNASAPAPVVLMLHGFTGTRDELAVKDTDDGVFTRTARELSKNGYASLRIDFRGSGESDGNWEDTTFSGQIKDAVAAIDWLKQNTQVDGSRISVLGWSQGGLVASHAVAERPEVNATILWAPVTNPMFTFSNLLGAETVMKAIAGDPQTPHTIKLPWGVETTLKGAFYQELPVKSAAAAVSAYPGPLMVIVGTRDTTVAPQPAAGQILMDYHSGKEELVVFDTDHVWDAFSGPATLDNKMIPTTLKWLNENR
ncbi:alpha/beta hydrolase [Hoeflea prorocentri]|uniref:Alpha/beta fold hydrolase n=1 Tax=Hoeflea prorocentri TaxID=1922333 RepID=A0A9X3ULT0_9HYPH|nr:alpha/beta fold hydrolase [Hoeflea prorocentri]MCY6382916.1 alpha/beta fold hydrolase [Hoeflea prorocentri]MDA5400716.1 alpha/beta fold hydrolase [Hoeflea prorocentri]